MRTPDGTVTTFNAPGVLYITRQAINPAELITGYVFRPPAIHGFLRTLDGAITQFDPPGGFFTFPTAINPAGAITGPYIDANFVQHGFLRLP